MSITGELREWWVRKFPVMDKELHEDFTAIADRIDAEHEAKVSYWQGASYKDGYDEGFASADDWFAQHESDMAEHGWIRLPKDADGEYIRIGDELDYLEALHTVVPARFKVQDMFYYGNGKWHLRAYPATYEPEKCRHHHAPTVEDVLREFTDAILEWSGKNGTVAEVGTWSDVAAEYAKRLTLAEGKD